MGRADLGGATGWSIDSGGAIELVIKRGGRDGRSTVGGRIRTALEEVTELIAADQMRRRPFAVGTSAKAFQRRFFGGLNESEKGATAGR